MYLGIDVGGTNTKVGVVDDKNHIVEKLVFDTETDLQPEELSSLLVEKIKYFTGKYPSIKTCGIGFPGIISDNGTIVFSPNIPLKTNYPLLSEIAKHFRRPIALENDANIAGYAELVAGAGRHMRNFIYVTLGTGVGAAIFINGELYRGMSGNAGELGHIIIDAVKQHEGSTKRYRTGTLESYTGKNAIIEYTNQTAEELGLSNSRDSFKDVREIELAAREGCVSAELALKKIGSLLGCGIVSAMNLLDIRNVVIGGGISGSEFIFNAVKETVATRSLPHISDSFLLERALFKEDTGIVGAAIFGKKAM